MVIQVRKFLLKFHAAQQLLLSGSIKAQTIARIADFGFFCLHKQINPVKGLVLRNGEALANTISFGRDTQMSSIPLLQHLLAAV